MFGTPMEGNIVGTELMSLLASTETALEIPSRWSSRRSNFDAIMSPRQGTFAQGIELTTNRLQFINKSGIGGFVYRMSHSED